MIGVKQHKLHIFILCCIFLLAFLLRFYKLGSVPLGFYQDESAIGYNAYSIMQTGRDEYGHVFPLYFKSFGDYKLPVYIYADIIPIKLFGLNEFAVRFPSAFFGFLTVVLFYFLIKEISGNKKLALIVSIFLAVNPWSLFYNRATFEVSISLFLFVLGTLLIHLACNKRIKGLFLLGTICFIFSLYSYNLTRLLAPLLYFLVLWFYWPKKKTVTKKELSITLVACGLLLLPFLLTLLKSGGVLSAQGTLLFSSAAIEAPLVELKSYFVGMSLVGKLFFNMFSLNVWQYIHNIISYFSVDFYFLSGELQGNHGIGNVGQFYFFEFPLMLFGIYMLIKNKLRWGYFMFLWAGITVLVASLTREAPQATRSFFLLVPLEIFSAYGLYSLLSCFSVLEDKKRKVFGAVIVLFFIIFNIAYYFGSYYVRFPIFYAKSWKLTDKDLSLYLKKNQNKYDKIIFDTNAGFIYTSLLFFNKFPPSEFQKTVVRYPDDSEGFSLVKSFGKYEYREIDWAKDYSMPHTLIVTTLGKKPVQIPSFKSFYFPMRPVVIAVKQSILVYPVEENSYVLVETK